MQRQNQPQPPLTLTLTESGLVWREDYHLELGDLACAWLIAENHYSEGIRAAWLAPKASK